MIEFQIKKGRKILSRHKTRKGAGRKLGKLLYNENNLSLVEVRKKKAKTKKRNK